MRPLLAACVLLLCACSRSESDREEAPPSLVEVAPATSGMAADFFEAFERDPAAAEATHAGKVVELTGIFFTWTLVERPGGSKAAADISLLSHGRSEKALFVLDREVMDKRYLILDYFSLIRMKGRYAGRDAEGTFRFTDSVLTTSRPDVRDHPTAAVVTAEDLARAFWPPERVGIEGRLYAGRVVEVTGSVQGFEEGELLLRAADESQPIHCHLADGLEAFRKTHEEGRPVRLKGFCAGHIAGTRGVTLEGCIVP